MYEMIEATSVIYDVRISNRIVLTKHNGNSNVLNEPRHEISNNVVCATNKASDQPVHTRNLTRAFVSRLNIL